MGLKSVASCGWGTFGKVTSFVALMNLGMMPIVKNSLTASHISGPVICQVDLKNPLLYPSGPRDLLLGVENKASVMSFSRKILHISICSVAMRTEPACIT